MDNVGKKIYVENLRSFLDLNTSEAKEILEIAVKQGILKKATQFCCETGGVLYSTETPNLLPKTLECWHLEGGDYVPKLHSASSLSQRQFYFKG